MNTKLGDIARECMTVLDSYKPGTIILNKQVSSLEELDNYKTEWQPSNIYLS